jgi:S1-C subfamily serine protease
MLLALRVLCVVVCAHFLGTAAAHADNFLDSRFEPSMLDSSERRLLQVALASAGDYRGPLDGAWSTDSRQAFEAYAEREFSGPARNVHAAALVIELLAEIDAEGWTVRHFPELGVSMALPEAVLADPESEDAGRRWWSRTGSLTLLTHRFEGDFAQAWHTAAQFANTVPDRLQTVRGPDLLITAGRLEDGRAYYTRSDHVDGHWATVYLASGPDQADMLNLIRSSISAGAATGWDLPPGGRLEALVRDTLAAIGEPEAFATLIPTDPGALVPRRGGSASAGGRHSEASGTAFYISSRVLVTAHHVVDGCNRIGLPDGTELTMLAHDSNLDIAALMAPSGARSWLAFSDGAEARLGQRVHAVGFPYYSIAGTSLHLTGGNVSSLADVNDDRRFFSFSSPVQPGNSGGPLIDTDGGVIGVVVSRLSERYIAEATGSLPQNINYALARPELDRFLAQHALQAAPAGLGHFDTDDGAPPGIEAAIVPVLCQ